MESYRPVAGYSSSSLAVSINTMSRAELMIPIEGPLT